VRPVRLELNGFASFRDHTVVDFTDADYFALIGPTGSGKSTILDAITFALYGTAYRWGATNAVADALAPSTNRCTVSLTFDSGPHRYQVAREVRRVGQTIQQKNPSLVRFADPHAVVIDPNGPAPEVLAGEIKELKTAIPELLGLDFHDFCQCVVLPQGQFAKFLSANPKDRQKILLKLLGAEHYEEIGRHANARAAAADNALEIYGDQLTKHADATVEAKAAADARVGALHDLLGELDELVPRVTAAATAVAAAVTEERQLGDNVVRLSGMAVPEGVDELQDGADLARRAAEDTRLDAEEDAVAADEARRAVTAGPRRVEVERARDHHAEVARLAERRPGIVETEAVSGIALSESKQDNDDVAAATTEARASVATLEERLAQAATLRTGLEQQRDALLDVQVPDDLADLVGAAKELAEQAEAARTELREAEVDAERLELQLHAISTNETLARAKEELDDWRTTTANLATLESEVETARESVEHARQDAVAAGDVLSTAEEKRALSGRVAGVAQLRPTLHVGEPCPVCEQQVSELPPLLGDPATAAAEAAVVGARAANEAAEQRVREAEDALRGADARVVVLEDRRSSTDRRLVDLLPERPSGEDRDHEADAALLTELEGRLADASAAHVKARHAVSEARARAESTRLAGEAAAGRLDQARAGLHTAYGALRAYDPPAVDSIDLEVAWRALHEWAARRLAELDVQLDQARAAHDDAVREHAERRGALEELEVKLSAAQEAVTSAATAAAAAAQARATLDERLAELTTLLEGAPSAEEVEALLAECTRLETALEAAAQVASTAREAATTRNDEWTTWRTRLTTAVDQLTAAREAVVVLTPPTLPSDDLAAAWRTLVEWAARRRTELEGSAAKLRDEAAAQRVEQDRLTEQITRRTREHGLEPPADSGPEHAPRVAAVALQKARSDAERIASSMAAAAELQEQIKAQRETQSVANMLAGLLRSNKFPRWLAASALDSLVAGASQSLLELSGGQYDLTHEDGEFFVIDHADADLTRSVKTLSGGETFQASLALALALSDHLAGMGGSTKLESIFLDEGFGTLDPDALETVAATLENLSQGERVVGVITHVAALAERAPVRFRVHRDTRTSHVERED
jgi:exonuclease SbcC